jgi:serine/threonine-protein kinase
MTRRENSSTRRLAQSVLIGLAALALVKAPPVDLGARLDNLLYDLWMRLDDPAPANEVVLLEITDPGTLPEVLKAAQAARMRLAVSLVGSPAGAPDGLTLLGPVAAPDADGALLVPSNVWKRGGHLWLAPETDGVMRRDRPFLRADNGNLPSLAAAAASALVANGAEPRLIDGDLFLGTRRWPMDEDGKTWLRFYPRAPFPIIEPAQLTAEPARFAGRTLVIDQSGAAALSTPVGELTRGSVLAHALSGYLQNQMIRLGLTAGLSWLILAVLLAIMLLLALRLSAAGLAVAAALLVATCLGASGAAWWSLQLWLPLAGPATLCVAVVGLAGLTRRWMPQELSDVDSPPGEDPVVRARRLSARGRLAEAWNLYRRVELDGSLLPELYRLGLSLEQAERRGEARDVFRHMANLDPGFRDIQHRLLDADRLSQNPPRDPVGSRGKSSQGREVPETLGRYEVLRELGRGAMGVVYLGRDPRINRPVAIKAIPLADEFDVDYLEEVRERFFREAETAGRLTHPNIVTIFDVGEDGDLAYIAMEYLEGHHLSDHAESDRLLAVPVVLELGARTADALHYAHRHKVVHRDIKPANIMYDSASDRLKITDFGIARLTDVSRTRTGIVLGTPSFMSPEQLEGKNVNGHTDLFALGVSLYQLLTGQLPFRGTSMTKLMFAIANQPHERMSALREDLPVSLDVIMARALAKKPDERFSTGAEFAAALRTAAAKLG